MLGAPGLNSQACHSNAAELLHTQFHTVLSSPQGDASLKEDKLALVCCQAPSFTVPMGARLPRSAAGARAVLVVAERFGDGRAPATAAATACVATLEVGNIDVSQPARDTSPVMCMFRDEGRQVGRADIG